MDACGLPHEYRDVLRTFAGFMHLWRKLQQIKEIIGNKWLFSGLASVVDSSAVTEVQLYLKLKLEIWKKR